MSLNLSNPDKNSCPICGGLKTMSKTSFTVDNTDGVILVREIPVLVCSQCGEEWLQDEVAEKLEEIVALAKKQKQQFFVVNYNQYSIAS